MKKAAYFFQLCLLIALQTLSAWSQDLPLPSGKYGIGYYRFEWTDSSRPEILSADKRMREITAELWYPAEKTSLEKIPYLDTPAIYRAMGYTGLQSLLGPEGARLLRSAGVHTHAAQNAAFDLRLKSCPVIFFSHGMGMIPQVYTAQIEELASHGYIVVGLSHAYDAWLVSLMDARYIPLETERRNTAGNTEEEHIAYENKRIDWWAADIRFALDQLIAINKRTTPDIPVVGRIDVERIGAMGHSTGGRAAARACQLDARIKSCADLDGVAMMQPFYPGTDGIGMKRPFLLFERDRNMNPSEADAESMNMTLADLTALVKSLRARKQAALSSTGGSFHVLLNFDRSNHMSFSDLPLLQAKTQEDAATASRILNAACRYTREFFDKTLKGIPAPLYERKVKLQDIDQVRQYPKSALLHER